MAPVAVSWDAAAKLVVSNWRHGNVVPTFSIRSVWRGNRRTRGHDGAEISRGGRRRKAAIAQLQMQSGRANQCRRQRYG
jgi:hypothetical protein